MTERFWEKVDQQASGGHWLWKAGILQNGYGMFWVAGGYSLKAHRMAWKLSRGAIPKGKHVLHLCRARDCVNPSHLYIGTHADNMQDKYRDGTMYCGTRHRDAKLTPAKVRRIRRSAKPGAHLAKEYGVTPEAIYAVRKGKTWKHVS